MLKKVIFPLYVPEGNYCYQGITEEDDTMCPHLIMDSGFPSCLLDFDPERDPDGISVLKDVECLELEDMK